MTTWGESRTVGGWSVGGVSGLEGIRPSSWSGRRLLRTLVEGSAQATGCFGLLRGNRPRGGWPRLRWRWPLVLFVGAGLLLRSFVDLVTLDRGYDPADVGRRRCEEVPVRHRALRARETFIEHEASKRRIYWELAEAMDRLSCLPEVEAAGVS